jgi:hypothetical protein
LFQSQKALLVGSYLFLNPRLNVSTTIGDFGDTVSQFFDAVPNRGECGLSIHKVVPNGLEDCCLGLYSVGHLAMARFGIFLKHFNGLFYRSERTVYAVARDPESLSVLFLKMTLIGQELVET